MEENNFYDKYYYLNYCGISYDKKENWEKFFGDIADRIVQEINPKTVLDAGCAYGYLVAALRDRGVEAYGIDISDYAIGQVRDDIKSYCEVGSVLEPLKRSYDLIICIEVIEHLKPAESRKAIENLCKNTVDFLFTSTPFDFNEATHFNVQPTEYWVKIFATLGFFRDTSFDASFVIDHAIRFRKQSFAIPEIIADYEKIFFRALVENKALRSELIQTRSLMSQRFNENESPLLAEKNKTISDKDKHIQNQDVEIKDKTKYITEVQQILKAKEEYVVHLEGLIKQKDELVEQTNVKITRLNESLHELDRQQLLQIEKISTANSDHLKAMSDQFNKLTLYIDLLNKTIIEKDEEIKQLIEGKKQITLLKDKERNDSEQILNELTLINEDYRNKLSAAYDEKNSKDRGINDLNHQLINQKNQTQFFISEHQGKLSEFERIKSLKGYKLLMKYYKMRDEFLMRNRRQITKPPKIEQNDVSIISPSSAITTVSESQTKAGITILNLEHEYYSKNPIYNIEFNYSPVISVVVPIFNTPAIVLEEMLQSVLFQTYPHLELCLVNASKDNVEVADVINRYMKTDERITYTEVENLGIAENTNAGIRIAKGEFIGLLDHDDIITPNALFEVVSRLQGDITAHDFFYSDKDMMLEDGRTTVNPLYKPQWSPEIMLSANYLTHFCVIRKSIIEKAGYLDSTTDGSQDWDIFLKVSRLTDKITHIPTSLYHWRIIKTSVASGIGAKPYALNAQLTSIRNHLAAMNQKATVNFVSQELGIIKVDWETYIKSVSFIITVPGKNILSSDLLQQIAAYGQTSGFETEIIVLAEKGNGQIKANDSIKIIRTENSNFYIDINQITTSLKGEVIVFVDCNVSFADNESIPELVKWASQKQYGAITPKLITKNDLILSTGIVLNGDSVVDVFGGAKKVEYTIFGYSEWYRNISAVRQECFAIRSSLLKESGGFNPEFNEFSCIELCLRLLRDGYRHVYVPFSSVILNNLDDLNKYVHNKYYSALKEFYAIKECDRYWNINLQLASAKPLENKRKLLKLTPSLAIGAKQSTGWERYSSDASYLANAFDFSTVDFEKNRQLIEENKGLLDIKSVNWFLPEFDFIYYAGLYTIFRFANHLQSVKGVKNNFIIVGGINASDTYSRIVEAFPLLKDSKVLCIGDVSDLNKAPYADASICSLWTTAYYQLRFNKTKRKFYFIQDFEPLFYPAGSTFGQTEATYKFGFYGITNTQGLRKIYEDQYNGKAVDLKPCIDTNIFYPNLRTKATNDKYRVFFYGRPGHPRNGFELGSAALRILKNKLKDKVEIYCAGSDWSPEEYGLGGVVNNIGRMDFEKTGDLYRVCDVGLVMMFTKHPSYLPFELMACGCAVVSNHNNDTKWFLKENVNCLLTEATATRIAETIENLLLNQDLRKQLVQNALQDIKNEHTSWNTELNAIYDFMCSLENLKKSKKKEEHQAAIGA